MKKRLSSCVDCGEYNVILSQVSSGPEIIFLCSDCYSFKYLKEIQNETKSLEKEKS